MLTIIELTEKAKMAGFDKWADLDSVNRGWYVDLLSEEGKKCRMSEEDLIKQQIFTEECIMEAKMEDAPVPTMTNELEDAPVIKEETPKKKDDLPVIVEYTPEDLSNYNMADLEDKFGFTVVSDERGTYEITNKLLEHMELMAMVNKPVKTILIQCADCGALRMVKVQDAFQVDRCVTHMKNYRNAVRRAKRKASK